MSQEWNTPGEGQKPLGDQPTPNTFSQPASTYTPAPAPDNRQPNRNMTWVFLVVIAALLGGCIYFAMRGNTITKEKTVVVHERDSISTSRDALQKDYDASIARLDDLTSKNTALNSQIADKEGEVAKMRAQIDAIMRDKNASASQLTKARQLINQLNNKVSGYEAQIAKLQGENKNLTDQNQNLNKTVEATKTENTQLQQKVALGAVLHASNIRMTAINLRRGGTKEKETERARKADLLRIVFDIDENRVAENGGKELYLRITAPDGTLLSNAAYGSGTTTDAQGQSLNYTLVKEIQVTQGQPVAGVSIDWKQQSDYAKGSYGIEIFNGGFRIGQGNVTLH